MGPLEGEQFDGQAVRILVAAAQSGDRSAADRLLAQYRPLLAAIIERATKRQDSNLANDDLWQEGFRHFLELLNEYHGESAVSFGRYLQQKLSWRLANVIRDERRRELRCEPLALKHNDLARDEMRADLGAGFNNPRLRAAYHQLSPKQRGVLYRVHSQNMAIAEIAGALGLTTQAVTAMRRRAEEKLREAIANEEAFD